MAGSITDVKSIFGKALEIASPAEREAYLAEACGGDPRVRAEVETLLRAGVAAEGFLDGLRPHPAPTIDLPPAAEVPGAVIGPYKLVEQIGEGGMGAVWMAQQTEPVKRLVAVKLIKAGMDSKQVMARFEAERQALALMDHPNIAKVLEAGTTPAGRPYFVMELVKGTPVTKYCDDHHLTPRQRLELFIPVCQAVQHAHQKGIIHRDLKPSNVLVAQYDGRPVPKVIDFGVAKAAGQPLTDRTLVTGFGAIVGTLEYMSPEQAEVNQLDIDTRSDIYSLGVLLYELLAGSPPFTKKELEKAGMLEMLRVIREQEPSKPSTKLSTAEGLPTLAANRGTEPSKLTRLLRGELDWIVMKALEKDRSRRYETANGFAADVQRYLADEPVQACPPSASYRIRKFARRNRRALAGAAVLAVAVLIAVAAVAGSVGWASRDRAARQAAVEQEATLALDDGERWREQGKWPEALSAAKRAEGLLAGGGSDELRERARHLRKDMEMVLQLEEIPLLYAEIRENKWNNEGIDRAYAEAFAAYGIDLFGVPVEQAAAQIRARPGVAVPLIDALGSWTGFQHDSDTRRRLREVAQAADSDPWRRQVREAAMQKNGNALVALAASPDLLRQPPASLRLLAGYLRGSGRGDVALEVYFRAQRQYPGEVWLNFNLALDLHKAKPSRLDEAVAYYRAALALLPRNVIIQSNLANALSQQKKLDEAVACYQKAIELDPTYAPAHNGLGCALENQNKLDDAIAAFKEAVKRDPTFAPAHFNLGRTLSQQNKLDDAIAAYREAIKLDPNYARAYTGLGNALLGQNRLDDAVEAYKEAVRLDPKDARAHYNLGYTLHRQNKLDDAIEAYKKVVELDPKDAEAHFAIGNALSDQKKPGEAITWFKKAIDIDPKYAPAHNNLGNALRDQKRLGEAITWFKKAIELNPKYAKAHYNLGLALHNQRKLDEAIASYKEAIELDPTYAPAHSDLGIALSDQKKLDDAIACYRRAIELDPKYVPAHINLGNALKAQRKLPQAITCYRTAIELDPKNAKAHNNLGNALKAQRKLDEAIACYRTAIELDPNYANAHLNLGLALDAQNKLDEAVACYQKAIELDPKSAPAHNGLGVVLKKQRKNEEAVACYKKAIELDPKYVPAHYNLGLALRELGKVTEAIACFRKVIELDPKNPKAHYSLGLALRVLGELDEAIACYRRAIELDPKYIEAHNNLGFALARKGLVADAIASYREAVRLEPDFVQAHRNWAWLVAAGPDRKYWDGKRAVELATRVNELAPKDDRNWCLLGAAHYRAGNWKEALAALQKSMEVRKGGQTTDWLLLAMVKWQQGDQEEARKWYDMAVERMQKNEVQDELSSRLKAEAAELLRIGSRVEVAPPPREKK